MLEVRRDSKTIVDWVNGHSKLKTKESTIASVQNILRDWWGRGAAFRQRVADWAIHIFFQHHKEANSWAGRGVKGHEKEWVDIADVVWSEVTGRCCFWDGSCESGACGAEMMIQMFIKTLGWLPIHKQCGPVRGRNSLEAKLGGCGVLMGEIGVSGLPKVLCVQPTTLRLCVSGVRGLWYWKFVGMRVRSFICQRHRFDCDQLVQTNPVVAGSNEGRPSQASLRHVLRQ